MSLHLRIQQKLEERNLRVADLARAAKVSPVAAGKWYHGTSQPKAQNLKDIAKFLGVTDDWLLTGKNPQKLDDLNMREFISKHKLDVKNESSFDKNDIQSPLIVDYEGDNQFIWIDVVEANFSCGSGESIEFHFDVVSGKQPFLPSFFYKKGIDPKNVKIIKAKGDSMAERIFDGDLVGIDMSQTEIIDGEIYAFYFEGEGMIKQIFKEEGGRLILHSLNPKYRDREVSEQNGLNFRVMGRQFWRAG
ncbi:LexA family transcriptional regulator [Acinetobacter sp. CFCC 10889]|uniref:LexA family transcriptional regulator n=1 Tax=Acinetobacter sp. CFCC 10889 TaxID=1775557 RepID=UPI000DCFF4E9|nr:LexA family transcriptional regulator [Acinetobacter sp. CFCC 10889]